MEEALEVDEEEKEDESGEWLMSSSVLAPSNNKN